MGYPGLTAAGSWWTGSVSEMAAEVGSTETMPWESSCPDGGYESMACIPLEAHGNVFGTVELTLTGVLAFNRFDLDLGYVEGLAQESAPLLARVRNATTPAEFEVAVDVEASRPELERHIVRELLERDARYRPAAVDWTRVALDVKRMALEKSTPETMIDYLRSARAEGVAPEREA